MSIEQGRYSLNKLQEDFLAGSDTPKEIEITCPGEDPVVTIKDLISESGENFDGECVVIKMSGKKFTFRMTLNCGENTRYNFDGEQS